MKKVEWSCDICGAKGFIEYESLGNPYSVGYQCHQAHAKASPHCHPLNLKFNPERI